MPRKKATTGIAARLGSAGQEAFDAHKEDETDFGAGGDLPAGIEGGVAQLVDCKFDVYKKGDMEDEYYFYAAGVVVSPTEFEGQKIEGLRTSIMEPICDTENRSRKTVDDHVQWVLNEMRKLGVDTTTIDFSDLDEAAAALVEEAPFFRFRTWVGKPSTQFPNPRTQHQWKGACDAPDEEGDGGVVEEEPKTKSKSRTSKAKAASKGKASSRKKPEPEPAEEEMSIDDLVAAAEDGDEEAQRDLQETAEGLGIEDVDSIETWTEVGEAITAAEEGDGEEEGDADEGDDAPPEKGEVYSFRPPRKRNYVDVEVTAVFPSKESCNVKDPDGKIHKNISWDKLVVEEE